MKKKIWFGFAISAACLYWALKGLSWRDMSLAFQSADLRWFAVATVIYPGVFLLRTLRWTVLMKPVHPVRGLCLFNPLIIGFFGNIVLPFRMGELLRAHVAGRKLGISRTAALGTIVLERLSDAISFLGVFLLIMFYFPFPEAVRAAAWGMGLACVCVMAGLAAFVLLPHRVNAVLEKLPLPPKLRDKIQELRINFTKGMTGLTWGTVLGRVLPLSFCIWLWEGTVLYLIARSFPTPVTFMGAFFVLFFIGLSVTLPQAPGYVGTMELFGTKALEYLGIPKEAGLPIILVLHGMQFVMISLMGFIALGKEGVSLNSMNQAPLDKPART